MSTPPNVSKRRTDIFQLETDVPGDAEPSNTLNTDPNANWGTEPNFNLNFNNSPSNNQTSTKGTLKTHFGSKMEGKTKRGEATMDFNTLPVPNEKLKSKIPAVSSSPLSQTVKNKPGQQPKSPNISNPSTPKIQMHENLAPSLKPNRLELKRSKRSEEKVTTGLSKAESANPLNAQTSGPTSGSANDKTPNLKIHSDRTDKDGKEIYLETPSKTLQLSKSQKLHSRKGDKSSVSPQLTNRSPTRMTKTKKTDPVDQKLKDDSRAQSALTTQGTSQKEKKESGLLCTKPAQVPSLIPKPSTQRKNTGNRNGTVLGSRRKFLYEDFKAAAESEISPTSSANSEATRGSNDSLDSKTSSKSQTESRDAPDSKSSSASKSILGSRDSLDYTKPKSAKANTISRIHSIELNTTMETRIQKTLQSAVSKTSLGTKNKHDSKHPQNSKTNDNPKIKTSLVSGSESDITWSLCPSTLQGSAINMDLLGCVSLNPISSGSIKTTCSAVELSLNPKNLSEFSSSGPVLSSSKSTLTDFSTPVSATKVPGSYTGKIFASAKTGSNRENQKSPCSSPGILAPLASSSPKTRPVVTSKMLEGSTDTSEVSAVVKRDPIISSRNTILTRGFTFDSNPGNNADKAHSKSAVSKVDPQAGLVVSQEAKNEGENGCKSVFLRDTADHPEGKTIVSSPWATSAKELKPKIQVHGKKNAGSHSSPLHPISSFSSHPPTKKKVKDTGAKTELSARLHKGPVAQKEVGIQVEVEVVERSASTSPNLHWGPPTSSLIGSSSCQSSLCCMPPLKHVCQIEIELTGQTPLPCNMPDRTSSLPACLHTDSFQQNPSLTSELGYNHSLDVSAERIREDDNKDEDKHQAEETEDGFKGQTDKPPGLLWDNQGMTWEVYGASVDLESLGTAIQSQLEMKIREQERHIRILRKSVCSNSSYARYKLKKRRRRFLGCCIKASTVAD